MPRIRYLKPDFFKDEDVSKLPHEIRLFYIGLWGLADKEGRLEDRPERLKIEIFPYDEKFEAGKALAILSKKKTTGRPFILRYEVAGERYIQIIQWNKHQKPHHTEKESAIPACNGDITVKEPLLNSEELLQVHGDGEGDGEGKYPLVDNPDFLSLWNSYPKKVGKKEAYKHFKASVKTDQDKKDIATALENYKSSDRVKRGFIKDGSSWFNNWQDWVEFKEAEQSPKSNSTTFKDDF